MTPWVPCLFGSAGRWQPELPRLDPPLSAQRVGVPGDDFIAPPVLGAGRAYAVSRPDGVVAFDASSAKAVWSFKTQTAWGACQLEGESLLVVPRPGVLAMVDPVTGGQRESHSVGELTLEYSAILSGRVVTPLEPGMLGAWDLESHRWSWRAPSGSNLSLIAGAAGLICVAEERAYVGLDLESGAERWRFDVTDVGRHTTVVFGERAGATVRHPIVTEDAVYAGITGGRMVALDPASGNQKWQLEVGVLFPQNFTLTPGGELLLLSDEALTVVDARGGRMISQRRLANQQRINGDGPFAPMALSENFIWSVDALGGIVAISPTEARIVFRYPLRRASYPPIIGENRLFVVDSAGQLTILSAGLREGL